MENAGFGVITKDLDLKNTNNIKDSKKRTFSQFKTKTESLVSFEEVKENFIGIHEAEAMRTYLDMGNKYIYNVKTPTSNDQAANKTYVDTKTSNVLNASSMMYAAKSDLDDYLNKDGTIAMTGNLDMNNNRIYSLPNQINQQHWVLLTSSISTLIGQPQWEET